jgi:hypothetical protein
MATKLMNGVRVEITQEELAVIQTPYQPTEEEIANEYKLQRADEYPSIGDQLDMIFKSGVLDNSDWATAIQAVKDKYPKPSE